MKIIFFLPFIFASAWAQKPTAVSTYDDLLNSPELTVAKIDVIIAEHIVGLIKLVDKGYVNQELLKKLESNVQTSKHFKIIEPWLKSIKQASTLNSASELITACRDFSQAKQKLALERRLERIAGNYCRERTLEAIGKDIEKNKAISEEATAFIQANLKFYLTKKNKKNFSFFIQSLSDQPEILKKISQEVTTYSVSHEIVPSQEVLKDIEINEQITKLIQTKGFNPLQHKNVFYAEFGKLIEQAYKSLDDRAEKPTEAKVKEQYNFLKNYLELNQDHLPLGLCLSRLNDLSKAIYRGGFADLSRDIFKYIIKKNNKEILEDAHFFYLWTYISTNDYKTALKIAAKSELTGKKPAADPRLRYWIAYCQEKENKKKEAIAIYEGIVASAPLSYYSILSTKRLKEISPNSGAVNFYRNAVSATIAGPTIDLKTLDQDHLSSLVRLRTWAKIDNQKLVNLELKRLHRHSNPSLIVKLPTDKQLALKSDLYLLNAKIIQDGKNYLSTFRYIYEVLDKKEVIFNRALLELLYPKAYFQELLKALKSDSNLDPLVVLSLIRQESVFNPNARSPVGARGLMQLMPMTAKRLKRGVREKHLSNPKLNLDLGTKYLKGLVKRYEGNLVFVLSAYNAGETRVERWKNLYWNMDDTITKNIEQIPFLETRNYNKLIFRNIFFYKLLNSDLTDVQEANKIFDVYLGFKH